MCAPHVIRREHLNGFGLNSFEKIVVEAAKLMLFLDLQKVANQSWYLRYHHHRKILNQRRTYPIRYVSFIKRETYFQVKTMFYILIIQYTLWVGSNVTEAFSLSLVSPKNTTFFRAMTQAADMDPHFAFEAREWPNGHYVHTLGQLMILKPVHRLNIPFMFH